MRETLLVVALFLLAPLAALPEPVGAQGDNCTSDAANDPILYTPSTPPLAGQPGQPGQPGPDDPVEAFKNVDIIEMCIGEETDRDFTVRVTVTDLRRSPDTKNVGGNVDFLTCFTFSGNGELYRLWSRFSYPQNILATEMMPVHSMSLLQLVDECPAFQAGGNDVFLQHQGFVKENVTTTLDGNTIISKVLRDTFSDPQLNTERNVGPKPTSGDTLSGVSTTSRLWGLSNSVIAEDTAEGPDLGFVIASCGPGIRLNVPSNVNLGRLEGLVDRKVPAYGVDVGSFQTVPVVINNDIAEPVNVNLSVELKDGNAAEWDVRIIPAIPVPAASGGHSGNTTVTLIVNSAPTIQHKDKVRIQILGNVSGKAATCGSALVDVLGVVPPDVGQRTVYFHGQGRPCNGGSWWINTLETDPLGTMTDLPAHSCAEDGATSGSTGAGENLFRFRPDVEHARHYTLDALQDATASVAFKSSQIINPPTGQQEIFIPTTANIVAELFSGDVPVGKGVAERVPLEDGKSTISIPIDIFADNRLVTTRYVPNEKPLNVAFTVELLNTQFVIGNGLTGGEQTTEVPASPPTNVKMVLGSSSLTIPIIDSERSGDIINVTKSGALVSMRISGEKTAFMNPGKTKVFNVTLRNEGVNPDTITLSATMNKTGWIAMIQPKTVFKLGVGVAQTFEVLIKVPESVGEEESVRMDLVAVSKVDPEAQARLGLVLKATKGTILADEAPEFSASGGVTGEKKKGSPGPGTLASLAVLGAALVATRRRRRE